MPANLISTTTREFPSSRRPTGGSQRRVGAWPTPTQGSTTSADIARRLLAILIPVLLASAIDQLWPTPLTCFAGLAGSLLIVGSILGSDSETRAGLATQSVLNWMTFPVALLLLLGSLHWQLSVLCLCLAVPAVLLETSARRVNVLAATRGFHSTEIQAMRSRLRGMAVDLLRLFGLLLLGTSTVWLSQQPAVTPGQLCLSVILIVEYVWWLSVRLEHLLRENPTQVAR